MIERNCIANVLSMVRTALLGLCLLLGSASAADEPLQVVYEANVAVSMRDGVVLRANVHRPDRGGPYPVLVMRTPYGKGGAGRFDQYVKAGYIVVAQDARGRYDSDGQWESFVRFETHDAEDGYDTVEWAAKLPNSSGKVGTFGASYNAFLQWRLASLAPPSLVAMSAHSIPARYTDLEGPGTIRPGRRLNWWIVGMTHDMRRRSGQPGTRTRAEAQQAWSSGEADKWLRFAPYLDLPREVFEDETEAVQYWLKNPHTDPWKLDEGVKTITVPNLNFVGWWDHCNGDMRLDRALREQAATETARRDSHTIIGPWGHVGMGSRRYGNIDVGAEAQLSIADYDIRWFDYWLKGKDAGIEKTAPYRIFVMGDNRWRDEPTWPVERAADKVLYLGGNSTLTTDAPAQHGSDRYTYDPHDPVPSLHGSALFQIPTDQRPLDERTDILVYQTEPLTERIEVTGNPVVELHASSSAPDTDFFVRLIDVHPDGLARDVSLGVVRARYRNGLDKPQLITPGETIRYTIRMNPTSNAFLPGHRLRLDITSSDFPNYDRNHNTAADQNADGELKTAEQTIYHGGRHATRIILPWIPQE
ncbi:MAG: CocE/NonD family hydrolase [Planctomycetia bacterium]|nr:CocE/NonD family hydrolase [Planctomycetia bacterium]